MNRISGALGAFVLVAAAAYAGEPPQKADPAPRSPTVQTPAAKAKKEPATRPARPQEVRVRVFLLGEMKDAKNDEEYIEVGGKRYIHFASPQLRTRARPLEEPKLRYPAGQVKQRNGAVILQLLIDEAGALAGTDVVCAAPEFEQSARESVTGLRFKPALARNGTVRSYMLVEFAYGKGVPCGKIPD